MLSMEHRRKVGAGGGYPEVQIGLCACIAVLGIHALEWPVHKDVKLLKVCMSGSATYKQRHPSDTKKWVSGCGGGPQPGGMKT